MHGPIAKGVSLRIVALCLLLAGCAAPVPELFVFADAGKYQFHNCEQLGAIAKAQETRGRELKEMIDRSEQSAGGTVVSVLAYRADYVAVSEDLRVIDSTLRAKNCNPQPSWQSNSAIR